MVGRRARRLLLISAGLVLAMTVVVPAGAQPPTDLTDDGQGHRWRQLTDTVGLSWESVAQVCPQDGVSRCSGSVGGKDLTGWIWATPDQVEGVLGLYEPAILTADPPSVSGPDQFGTANGFLTAMRPTFSVTGYNFHTSWAAGWTAYKDASGVPIRGVASFGWYPIAGGFHVVATPPSQALGTGVWLWRPAGEDITPPTITPTVSGTQGTNGWYVSDVTVTWTVSDAESEVTATSNCGPSTISTDTAGTTVTCQATSSGGTASASTVVTRDVTPPTVTCPSPTPVFQIYQLGALVQATVTDATSGRSSPPAANGLGNTNTPGSFTVSVTGADRAGHRTTVPCPYEVVIPPCNGLAPTILGNGQNNAITGTSGRDIIVALAGADTINGLGGDDVICGGDGPDTVYGGDGKDWIDGGASPDDLNGGNGDDFIDGGLHNDSIRGDSGRDTCVSGEQRMSSCEA